MADVNAAPDQEYNDDGSKNPDFVAPKIESESDAPDTKKDGEEEGDKGKGDDDQGTDFDDNAEPAIPIRQSAAQHIIARKNDKIKKLQSKVDGGNDAGKEDDEEGDDNLSEDARGAISKEVENRIAPIVETLVTQADEKELKDLFASAPEAKKYEKHIKAYMGHESYKGVSPEVIFHHLAYNNALAEGARKRKVADLEANQNKGGGRGLPGKGGEVDGLPTAEDIAGMSDEDFDKMEADARQGKYIRK